MLTSFLKYSRPNVVRTITDTKWLRPNNMKRSITEIFQTNGQKKLKQPDISDIVVTPELRLSCAMANNLEISAYAIVDADSIVEQSEQETEESNNESIGTCDSTTDEEDADVLGPQVEETIYIRKVSPGPKDLSRLPSDAATQPILRSYP